MVRNKDAVADFEIFHFAANLVNDACCFMTQHQRSPGYAVPFGYVAAAYAARHNLKQRLIFPDLRDWHFLDANVMVVVVDGGKQEVSPRKRKCWFKLCRLLPD
jgi:hypothetical protein